MEQVHIELNIQVGKQQVFVCMFFLSSGRYLQSCLHLVPGTAALAGLALGSTPGGESSSNEKHGKPSDSSLARQCLGLHKVKC